MDRTSIADRLETKFVPEPNTGCWLWIAGKNSAGYGVIRDDREKRRMRLAHRISYEIHKGPIPGHLELDHLCRTPACINPEHLEAVTRSENQRRGMAGTVNKDRGQAQAHCLRGHEFTSRNTRIYQGNRTCRSCRRERMRTTRLKVNHG